MTDHGTYSRYRAGCRCDTCTDGAYRKEKAYRRHVAQHGRILTDPAEVTAVIRGWAAAGWSWNALEQATGINHRYLQRLASDEPAGLMPDTIRRVQNADFSIIRGRVFVPLAPTLRRLQALQRLGWTWEAIAAEIGLPVGRLKMLRAKIRTTADTAHTIRSAYDRLSMIVPDGPDATRARAMAARAGYPPPMAWDNIDDPDEHPTGIRGRERHTVNSDDLIDLIEHGCILADLEERYGCTANTVYEGLRRAGRGDLWARIRAPRRGGVQHAA